MAEATRAEVAVVGGGIGGLSAAYALAKRGVPFALLEASPRFGGVIRTEREAGFVLEGGPDAILAQKPEGIALCRELGLGDRLVPTNPGQRTVFVLHRRRLHPLPEGMVLAVPTRLTPFLRSHLFSWTGKLRMGLDVVIPRRKESGDESIASFIRRRLGSECLERLGEPLLAGIHAGDPERLSIRGTFPRLVDLEARHGSLIRGTWAAPGTKRSASSAVFYSLRGGLSELVDALVARLPGASLLAERAVRSLARTGDRYVLRLDGGETVSVRAVIVALPAPRTAPLLEVLAPEVARALADIPFASTATVVIGHRRVDVAHSLDGYGLVIPRTEGLRTSAVGFFSTKFPGRAPEGHVLLRGFLGGARDPDVLDLDDSALAGILRREIGPILGIAGEPVLTRVYRWPRGTPQMEVGHGDRIAEVDRRLAAVPGLFLTGAGLRVTGLPDVIAEGMATAAMAAGHLMTVI